MARSITLARIASPISVQKRYQPLVLSALKEYFQNSSRLLKKGDIIALPICTMDILILDGLIENDAKVVEEPEETFDRYGTF